MTRRSTSSMLIVLSAKDKNRLIERASDLVAYLIAGTTGEANRPRLLDIAYTLQIGREPMEERLAFLADSLEVGDREAHPVRLGSH